MMRKVRQRNIGPTHTYKTVVLSTRCIAPGRWEEICQDYWLHATKGWRKDFRRRYRRVALKFFMNEEARGYVQA